MFLENQGPNPKSNSTGILLRFFVCFKLQNNSAHRQNYKYYYKQIQLVKTGICRPIKFRVCMFSSTITLHNCHRSHSLYLPALVMIISVPISQNLFHSSEPCSSTRTSLSGRQSLSFGLLSSPLVSASSALDLTVCLSGSQEVTSVLLGVEPAFFIWLTGYSLRPMKRQRLG